MDNLELLETIALGSARGAKAKPLALQMDRELSAEDLAALANAPALGSTTPDLVKLHYKHHMLARLLAEGRSHVDAGALAGYSSSRISLLQKDPAFKELLEYYKAQLDGVYVGIHERLSAIGVAAAEEIAERIETRPDALAIRELLEVMKETLDRSGATPQPGRGLSPAGGVSGGVTVNLKFVSPEPRPALQGRVVDAVVEEVPSR